MLRITGDLNKCNGWVSFNGQNGAIRSISFDSSINDFGFGNLHHTIRMELVFDHLPPQSPYEASDDSILNSVIKQ